MLPRRPVDPRTLLTGLAPTLRDAPLRELGEGFDNVAYAVDGRWLLRISKIADAELRSRTVERDIALADLASRHSTIATTRVEAADADAGVLLGTLVRGVGADRRVPRDAAEFAATMSAFLQGLASIPAELALAVAGPPSTTANEWLAQTTRSYEEAAHLLPADLRPHIERFLAEPVRAEDHRMLFCHNDLGDEHIIVDTDGRVTGVIDWSDAVAGDPARDLALLMFDIGPGFADLVAPGLGPGDPGVLERARWWALRAGVEGVAWRALHDRPVEETLRRLRRVFAY